MLQLMHEKMKFNEKPTTLKRQKPIQTFPIWEGSPTNTAAVPHNYQPFTCPMIFWISHDMDQFCFVLICLKNTVNH